MKKFVLKIESPVIVANGLTDAGVKKLQELADDNSQVARQLDVVSFIISNNGCKDVSCLGHGGVFNGVICPLGTGMGDRSTSCSYNSSPVIAATAWLKKYHQRKTETTRIERIAQLEKENADLKAQVADLTAQVKRLDEACEEGSCGFDLLRRNNAILQSANALLREELKRAGNYTHRQWNEEHKRMLQRIKELERQLRKRDQWPPRPRDRHFL